MLKNPFHYLKIDLLKNIFFFFSLRMVNIFTDLLQSLRSFENSSLIYELKFFNFLFFFHEIYNVYSEKKRAK